MEGSRQTILEATHKMVRRRPQIGGMSRLRQRMDRVIQQMHGCPSGRMTPAVRLVVSVISCPSANLVLSSVRDSDHEVFRSP